jgi:hypothetical protein
MRRISLPLFASKNLCFQNQKNYKNFRPKPKLIPSKSLKVQTDWLSFDIEGSDLHLKLYFTHELGHSVFGFLL